MEEYSWSKIEKKEARKIFNEALQKECDIMIERIRDFSSMATSLQDLVGINDYMTKSLAKIYRKYDYRYSQLINLFALLLAEERISESDLEVFSADKVERIISLANFIKSRA